MIEQAIHAKVLATAAITAICSSRVYAIKVPQGATFPAISYERVSTGLRDLTHNGTNQVAEPIFQFNCFADNPKTAKQLAAELRKALHGWSGTQSGETIFRSQVINELDLWDDEIEIYHVVVEVEILHREA